MSDDIDKTSFTYSGGDTVAISDKVRKVVISDSVENISPKAFYHRTQLENVIFSKSSSSACAKIGKQAFEGCKNITSVTFPEEEDTVGLTDIGDDSFYGCSSLQSIQFPKGLQHIGESAFQNCTALTSVQFSDNNDDDPTELLITIDEDAFRHCTALKTIAIPEGVKTIATSTFLGCSNLASVSFPTTLEEIEDRAFMACASLKDYTIPEGVKVATNAFHGLQQQQNQEEGALVVVPDKKTDDEVDDEVDNNTEDNNEVDDNEVSDDEVDDEVDDDQTTPGTPDDTNGPDQLDTLDIVLDPGKLMCGFKGTPPVLTEILPESMLYGKVKEGMQVHILSLKSGARYYDTTTIELTNALKESETQEGRVITFVPTIDKKEDEPSSEPVVTTTPPKPNPYVSPKKRIIPKRKNKVAAASSEADGFIKAVSGTRQKKKTLKTTNSRSKVLQPKSNRMHHSDTWC